LSLLTQNCAFTALSLMMYEFLSVVDKMSGLHKALDEEDADRVWELRDEMKNQLKSDGFNFLADICLNYMDNIYSAYESAQSKKDAKK